MVHQIPAEAIFGIGSTHARDGKLAVERGRYFEAIHLLNQFEQTGEMPPERSPSGDDWTCASCGEENPATFDVCWSCSAEHNSPRD
ncbi:MAG: hypothetical protein IPK83_00335 [Planctomycetes bacterium]|nr:hypothetical protein [Planctomycetota bacterium]